VGYGGGNFFSMLFHEVAKALSLMNCKNKLSKAKLIRFFPKKLKKRKFGSSWNTRQAGY
jgi:hypothetical protein